MHNSLENYYKTNFALVQHHKYSLTEIENLMPWERDVYVNLLLGTTSLKRKDARNKINHECHFNGRSNY